MSWRCRISNLVSIYSQSSLLDDSSPPPGGQATPRQAFRDGYQNWYTTLAAGRILQNAHIDCVSIGHYNEWTNYASNHCYYDSIMTISYYSFRN